jgi:2-(1,2-epoxy-1,2-dihydrophenyl)acetyl-CoA isomerase
MEAKMLQLEIKERVARIVLNRPETYNALDRTMVDELWQALESLGRDPGVRAVILTGAGKAFCSGGDVGAMEAFIEEGVHPPSVMFQDFVRRLHGIIVEIRRMPKPVIGAVNGVAAGGGFSLALACDLIIASDAARFTLAYTRLGVPPDGGSTFFLPRLLGPARAAELIYLNPLLSARDALEWGLVTEVVAAEDLHGKSLEMAKDLARGPTQTYAMVKSLLNGTWNNTLETQLEEERRHIMAASLMDDFKEGVAAFQAKRPPQFKGV